jgi:hypothetical protein
MRPTRGTAESDWPPEVRGLPLVTAPRIDTSELGSLEIDRAVPGGDRRQALALHDRRGANRRARADLIPYAGPVRGLRSLHRGEPTVQGRREVVSLDSRTIDEIEESVLRLAGRLGLPDRGAAVVADMRAKSAAPASSSPVRAVWRAPRRRHGRRRTHRPLVHHATMMPPRARPTGSASGASTSSLPLRPPRFATPDGERKTPTAMSFAVGPSLYPHRSTALEENDI